MATAEELLAMSNSTPARTATAIEEESTVLELDLDTRLITIPGSIAILGVESDDDVKRLEFRMGRYYGEFDLSRFEIRVNFTNARGKGDFYLVEDKTIVDRNYITFTWLVDRLALQYKGDVTFSVCLKLFENDIVVKEFNSTIAKLPVLEGLETESAVVDNNPSAFDTVIGRLIAVETATGLGRTGYYSIVRIEGSEDGAAVVVLNQDGETTGYIRNGEPGRDGYTPRKGVDYWTEDEKTEVKTAAASYATNYVDTWAPQTISVNIPANGWSNNRQRISVQGVSTTNIIVVSSDQTYAKYKEYASCCVRCVAQENNALTFECERKPSIDLKANIAVYYSTASSGTLSNFSVTDDGEGNVVIT